MRRAAAGVLLCALGCAPEATPVDAGGDGGPPADAVTTDAPAGGCAFGAVETLPGLADGRLTEVSGIVSSRRDPGVRYVHNDSGETAARFFAVQEDGTTLAEIVIDGAPTPRDWEDVAIETAIDGREILTFGDVGDNAARDGSGTPRASISVVRVEPPTLPASPSATPIHVAALSVTTLTYPDGPHDCEAIFVEPESGDLFLVTKVESGPAGLYRAAAPLLDGETRTLEHVLDLLPADPLVTAADADERFVVVRNYGRAWLWERGGRSIAATLAEPGRRLPAVAQPQGEAVAIEGDAIVFASEGVGTPLHRVPLTCSP